MLSERGLSAGGKPSSLTRGTADVATSPGDEMARRLATYGECYLICRRDAASLATR
jgi:hypothetical protein